MFAHVRIIGMQASIFTAGKLSHGVITDSYTEDNSHIVQINNDYEIVASRCEEVLDLLTGKAIIRIYSL